MTALLYLDVDSPDGSTIEYAITASSFDPGRPSRSGHWLDPSGDPGEIELAPFCVVHRDGHEVGVVPLSVALLDYAASLGRPVAEVERRVEDDAFEAACELEADADEDARQSWAEDRAEAGRWF